MSAPPVARAKARPSGSGRSAPGATYSPCRCSVCVPVTTCDRGSNKRSSRGGCSRLDTTLVTRADATLEARADGVRRVSFEVPIPGARGSVRSQAIDRCSRSAGTATSGVLDSATNVERKIKRAEGRRDCRAAARASRRILSHRRDHARLCQMQPIAAASASSGGGRFAVRRTTRRAAVAWLRARRDEA